VGGNLLEGIEVIGLKNSPLHDRIEGGLLGLALGDALCRPSGHLSPDAAASQFERRENATPRESLLHGATTTGALAFLDALLLPRPAPSLAATLALKVESFADVEDGLALRGPSLGLKGAWLKAGAGLSEGNRPALVGSGNIRADSLPLALPLAFALGDSDDEVAETLVEGLTLFHRHPRVIASAGFLLGGWRHLAGKGKGDLVALFQAGMPMAEQALAHLERHQKGIITERSDIALAALQTEMGGIDPDVAPRDLLFPPGTDGRDAPERCVALALCASQLEGPPAMAFLEEVARLGGASDVIGPLVGASLGLRLGGQRLPLGWMQRLAQRSLLDSRLSLLRGSGAPTPVLLEWELAASRGMDLPSEDAASDPAKPKEQLKLL
jgi:hypothetical protein